MNVLHINSSPRGERSASRRLSARIKSRILAEFPDATVVVREGTIEAVGTDAKVPPDALVIEGKGLTVYAGFIDALGTWGFDQAQRRSAIGMPTTEDFASEALAATQSDNRKGMTLQRTSASVSTSGS